MKKEISYALFTVICYYILFFLKGVLIGICAGAGIPFSWILNAVLALLFPALAIRLVINWRKMDINTVNPGTYFRYLLLFLLVTSFALMFGSFTAMYADALIGHTTSFAIGNVIGKVIGSVILPYILFGISFWMMRKSK